MIKTLIIDDEQHAINTIANHLKPNNNYTICGTAKTVDEAITITKQQQPSLVFLDIVLGSKTGFDYLNVFYPNIDFNVIFTTGYNEYAVKAFDYSALHFLLKPVTSEKFQDALLRMSQKVSQQENLERLKSLEYNFKNPNGYKFIHLSTSEDYFKIESKDILFIKSDSNYSHFFLANNKKIIISKTLKHYAEILKDTHFYKAHKSYLINTEQMKSYNRRTGLLTMNDDTNIPVAIRKRKDFVKTYFSEK
ncbi:LytTR family DNA-binding domain-containing protein [Flavivirga abyssicola]|uniref:LytR/AlgR family response regulator transcription factor n=1 Tax=Flavivirga abyssicola TaxID=3063533 RepID=UPI0026DEB77F|nr:LytTR family DNA-binding domain-containing protein [Flavivirga sp. MEBiC07777]WVK15077.1 LytTR family DNA-binding domain-containing protein [Flavivirga sp. MEBiC07777]